MGYSLRLRISLGEFDANWMLTSLSLLSVSCFLSSEGGNSLMTDGVLSHSEENTEGVGVRTGVATAGESRALVSDSTGV